MANRRFIDFPIASSVGENDIILIWQSGANKQTTKGTLLSGIATELENLTDVQITSLANGQILEYDSVIGKWKNVAKSDTDLSDLGDVSIVSPVTGQVLVYNATTGNWENSSAGLVPYVGAVTTVDLGLQGIKAGWVRFDTSVISVPEVQGTMYWDGDEETVAIILNGSTTKIGEDLFFQVKNQTGSTIPKGTNVGFAGVVGASGRILVTPYLANGSNPSLIFVGVTYESIPDGGDGKALSMGKIKGVDTTAFVIGDILFASPTVAGGFTTTKPIAPNNIISVAAVLSVGANGIILVRPQLASNINNDEGVKITTPATGELLQYQAGGLWENKNLSQILGGTSSQFVKGDASLDSTTYQNVADKGQPNGYASLDANSKVPLVQINDALIGNVNFQGLYNASTNTPTLVNPPTSDTKGYYYIVDTGGTFASITFEVGDWIISNGTAWGKVDNTDAVSSVFGRTGNVVASNGDYNTSQVTENTNLYYTDLRARGSLSFVAGSGGYNSTTGVITIPTNNNQITNGAGYITSETDTLQSVILRNGTTNTGFNIFNSNNTYTDPSNTNVPFIYLYNTGITSTSNAVVAIRTSSATGGDPILSFDIGGVIGWSMGIDNSDSDKFKISNSWNSLDAATRFSMSLDGTAVFVGNLSASNLSGTNTGNVTIGTANGLSLSGQALSLQLASGSTNGALSSTDWNTFNNKQNTLTNAVTGTGTTNFLPKFTGTSTIGNSSIFDNGTNVGVGTASNTTALLEVFGSAIQNGTNPGFRLSSSNTSQTVLAIVNTSSKSYELSVGGSAAGGLAGGFYIYDINTQKERFVVSSDGNVLVGSTLDNGALLQVSGGATFSLAQNASTIVSLTNTDNTNSSSRAVYRLTSGTVTSSLVSISTLGTFIGSETDHDLNLVTNGITRVIISSSTGAATFSSTVRATSTGVDGTFADAYIAQYSVTNAEANAIQTSVSGSAGSSGFRFQASNGNLSSARTTVVDFLRDRQIFYGNVGINQINPTSKLSISGDATSIEGLVNINNTKSTGSYFPALKVRNVNGNHTFGVVSEFSTGTTGGDRPTVLFYSTASSHSWALGQVSAGWGIADSFGIGYRANNAPNSFAGWQSNYFAITTGGNVMIGTTTDSGGRLQINGNTSIDTKTTTGVGSTGVGIANLSGSQGSTYFVTGTDGTNYFRSTIEQVQTTLNLISTVQSGTFTTRSFAIVSGVLNLSITPGTWTIKVTQIRHI